MLLKLCTISLSQFSWNNVSFLPDGFSVDYLDQRRFSKLPGRHGFKADRFVWVSAFLPHTNVVERQLGGRARDHPSWAAVHRFPLPRRRASKMTSVSLSVSVLITTLNFWALPGTRRRVALGVYHASSPSPQRLPDSADLEQHPAAAGS